MTGIEEVRRRIVESNLMSANAIDARIDQWRPTSPQQEPAALVHWLIEQQQLTEFQGEALLAGHAGPFLLGPYQVRERVAAGRLGHVFRAVHAEFNQPVSLKVYPRSLTDDAHKVAAMQREMRVATQLDHPHLLRTFQVGKVGQVFFLASEDLHGESLETRLWREGRLDYQEACRLIRQAALGLENMHQNEIVHRDLQPANIWITDGGQVKLIEFSAARDSLEFLDSAIDERQFKDLGEYTAPEQSRDFQRADARSDIYSLGCVLYHCLTGRPPFVAKDADEQRRSHAEVAPKIVKWLVPETPQALSDIVAGLLAKSPEQRLQSAAEVDWALEPFVEQGRGGQTQRSDWNPDYLAWVGSVNPPTGAGEPAKLEAGSLTPELSDFLEWMSEKPLSPR